MTKLKFYEILPRPLQNAALTIYGWSEYKHRYRLASPFEMDNLAAAMPEDAIVEIQERKLRHLLDHAERYVPFYKDLFSELGVTANDLNIENLSRIIPPLEKSQILANPAAFQSERWQSDGIKLFTSGSSGSPIPILASPRARQANYFYYRALLQKFDTDVRDRSVTFAGRAVVPSNATNNYWRVDRYSRTLYCSSYHLSEATIHAYVQALSRWDPLYIDAYPSAIATIARLIKEKSIPHKIRPRVIFTSSETLSSEQRAVIGDAFQCAVLDQYGSTEMAVMAWSTGEKYTIEPLYGIAELEPIASNTYSLICTGLLNAAMPLIRYKIGDIVTEHDGNKALPLTFAQIEGRIDDIIRTPEGRLVGRLDPAFKGVRGISAAQIIQTEIDHLVVKIVLMSNEVSTEEVQATLAQNLRKRTSAKMRISFDVVNGIPVGAAGKFKSVISKI